MSRAEPVSDGRQVVAGLGWILMDTCFTIQSYPAENSKTEASSVFRQVGGPAVRALMLLSRMGHQTVMFGAVGDDTTGETSVAEIAEIGVSTEFIEKRPGVTREASVWLVESTGSRTIAFSQDGPEPQLFQQTLEEIPVVGWLHLDGRHPATAAHLTVQAERRARVVSLDLGGFKVEHPALVEMSDLVIGPRSTWQEIANVKGTSLPLFLSGLVDSQKTVVVTDGSRRCSISNLDESYFCEPTQVDAVDSNGAGDVFAGALIHATLTGMELGQRLSFAAATAAVKCMRLGNDGIPSEADRDEILAWSDLHCLARQGDL